MSKRKQLLAVSQLIFSVLFTVLLAVAWQFYAQKQAMHKVLRSFNWQELWFSEFFWQLSYYIVAILLLHLFVGFFLWLLFDRAARIVPRIQDNYFSLGLLWLLAGVEFILLSNQFLFPQSIFATLEYNSIGLGLAWLFMGCFVVVGLGLGLLALFDLMQRVSWHKMGLAAVPLLIVGVLFSDFATRPAIATAHNPEAKPNVILIGVDSLRLDEISPQATPVIAEFLQESLRFNKAYTPLARTYTAWMSILTGHYPIQHGARFNLIDESALVEKPKLPELMRQAGYDTAYSIDERLFSNLGKEMGFDSIIAPPTGAIDFIMTNYGDFPLTNLVSSSKFAELFLPSLYANRAAYNIYQPELHSKRLEAFLADRRAYNPLFMVAHFCLPHWPYIWAKTDVITGEERMAHSYRQALTVADQQVGDLLQNLDKLGYLNNAVVVLLSDHGESLPGERELFHQPDGTEQLIGRFGHGSSVLSMRQNQVLLAWRKFGAAPFAHGEVQQAANLIDIAPTIQDMLLPNAHAEFAGESLLPWLKHANQETKSRDFFLESGFYLPEMERLVDDMGATTTVASQYYRINEQGKVRIKAEKMPQLFSSKQRALLRADEDKLVAIIPEPDHKLAVVGLDLASNRYYTEAELFRDPSFVNIYDDLCAFYATDIKKSYPEYRCSK